MLGYAGAKAGGEIRSKVKEATREYFWRKFVDGTGAINSRPELEGGSRKCRFRESKLRTLTVR